MGALLTAHLMERIWRDWTSGYRGDHHYPEFRIGTEWIETDGE
jgi:hypothetical protein